MGPESILLSLRAGGREGTYRFTCPVCLDDVEKRADRKIVALLVSAGVDVSGDDEAAASRRPRRARAGDELADPRRRSEAPPLTLDDLIDFHFKLGDDRWLQGFLATH